MHTPAPRVTFHLAIASAVVLIFAACGLERSTPRRVMQPATVLLPPTRSLPPLPVRPLSPRLEAARERVAAAAAAMRDLEWKSKPGMTELTGWEYGTRTKVVAETLGGDDLKALSQLAVAGGILPEGTDLATLAVSFTALSSGATYSPLDRQVLVLADDSKTESARSDSLLTHEFVHSLQDQHFDLLSLLLARPYNFDRAEALFALVEGDAMNVQRRFENGPAWSRRSLEDIARQEDERFAEYRRGIGALFPPLLTETFIFRYRDGARFVEAIRRARPPRSTDEIYRRPPRSSEQVLHPEKYLAALTGAGRDEPREVSVDEQRFNAGGWQTRASTPLGEIGVRGLLMAGVPGREAVRAAAGWGGDRAYVFERSGGGLGGTSLFIWRTVWDKREDAQEFWRAYGALLRHRAGREAGDSLAPGGESSLVWREAAHLTVVRLDGDSVLVVRGNENDLPAALQLLQN